MDGDSGSIPADSAQPDGAGYGQVLAAFRMLQDRIAGAVLPSELESVVITRLAELSAYLANFQVDERSRHDGQRPDLPGRGSPLVPPYIITEAGGDGAIRGHVTYDRFYLGGNSAVHGGANALLFDDLLGKLVNHRQERMARTASLTVSYRQVTPLNAELGVEAHIDRIDGRKRTTSGRLVTKAGVVLAEAKGLFVELQDGQP